MKVVIIGFFPETAKDRIRGSFPCAWDVKIVLPDEAEQELTDADVLIPEHILIDDGILQKAPKLRLVQTGAGYDNVNLRACTKHGVQVCNAEGVNANAVAEHVMALILCWYKNILKLDKFLKTTIGLVGFGHVGKKVAEYCNAFHMKVLVYSHHPTDAAGIEQRDLESLLRDSDIVSLHVPLNESTRHMINADVFSKMKSDAVLINTSRGGVVDEPQLLQALEKGLIGGACLDVFEEEPLRRDHPLRRMDNVILTPHTAGLPDGVKYHRKRYEFFVKNIERVMKNETPDCRINNLVK